MNKKRIAGITLLVISIGLLIAFVINKVGFGFFTDPARLKAFISGFGVWAPLVFFSLQFLQVIIAPIPGNVLGVVGGGLFGFVNSLILNGLAIYLGSMAMFAIGKHFSERVALKFVEKETYDHYLKIVSGKKGKLSLFLAFLLPFFPDDALCLIAGSSNLSYKEFIVFFTACKDTGDIISRAFGCGIYRQGF